jgi:thioredoxin 1
MEAKAPGGIMRKAGTILITISVFLLLGGLIVGWSVFHRESPIVSPANIKDFTDENFQTEVVEASKTLPILVDFYAEWCFPCRMLDPILEEVARDLQGKAVIGKLDTDKNLIARRFGISRIPAIFIIRDGEIKNSFHGVVSKETILKALREYGA